MGHQLWIVWNWPYGIVVGNLLASAIWGIPSLWHLNRKINRYHKWHLEKHDSLKDSA